MIRALNRWIRNCLIDCLQYPLIRYGIPPLLGLLFIVYATLINPAIVQVRLGGDWSDLLLGTITLIVTTMIFINQLKRELEEGLPKYLWVDFLFGARIVMRIEDVVLLSEGDIRALAQQMGRQLNEGRDLSISGYSSPEVQILPRNRERFKRYTIQIRLTRLPERHQEIAPGAPENTMIVQTQVGLDMRRENRAAILLPSEGLTVA